MDTTEDRAARIALRERLARASAYDLLDVVEAAGDHPLHDRRASVALELLLERGALPDDLAVRIASTQFERPLTPHDDEDDELVRSAVTLLFGVSPVRFLEVLAPVLVSGRSRWPHRVLELLAAQLECAWTDEARGFDERDLPRGPTPDPGWQELVERVAPALRSASLVDLDDVIAGLAWTYLPRMNRVVRRIASGAEEGAAFALAGFDVSMVEKQKVVRALDGLGGAPLTNLHLVDHQCGGLGCQQVTLLGLPLASNALREEGTPSSPIVEELLDVLSGGDLVTRMSRPLDRHASDPWTSFRHPIRGERRAASSSLRTTPCVRAAPSVRLTNGSSSRWGDA